MTSRSHFTVPVPPLVSMVTLNEHVELVPSNEHELNETETPVTCTARTVVGGVVVVVPPPEVGRVVVVVPPPERLGAVVDVVALMTTGALVVVEVAELGAAVVVVLEAAAAVVEVVLDVVVVLWRPAIFGLGPDVAPTTMPAIITPRRTMPTSPATSGQRRRATKEAGSSSGTRPP
ncbi:MAG: hypothetical protein ACYDD4_13410 [Acidimicrobiales bacterium]